MISRRGVDDLKPLQLRMRFAPSACAISAAVMRSWLQAVVIAAGQEGIDVLSLARSTGAATRDWQCLHLVADQVTNDARCFARSPFELSYDRAVRLEHLDRAMEWLNDTSGIKPPP